MKDFEKWLIDQPYMFRIKPIEWFYNDIPFSMQWGFYLEYFDSRGVWLDSYVDEVLDLPFCYQVNQKEEVVFFKSGFITRQEAQKAAIKKAFELL